MSLYLQNYLRAGGTPEKLKDKLGINYKVHSKYSNLILFKYDQIDSPPNDPIVVESRGIILDRDDNWNVVAHGFNRFFNYGDPLAANIDWKTASVQEKKDGSLCLLYHYKDEWHVATSGTPDASGEVNGSGTTFAKMFWDTLNNYYPNSFLDNNIVPTNYCFMFELTGPFNRVVVDYKENELTILGGRDLISGNELTAKEVGNIFTTVPVVKEFPLQTIEDILSSFKDMNPLEQEGYVVLDAYFNRMKVKHAGYVALHHAKDGLNASIKNFVYIVLKGETAEYLSAFPELKAKMHEVKDKYNDLVISLQKVYIKHSHLSSQKDFALAIKDNCRHTGALFALRSGKVKSIKEYLASCHIKVVMRLLGYK